MRNAHAGPPETAAVIAYDRRDLHRRVFETGAEAVLVIDATGAIVIANERAAALFGCNADHLSHVGIDKLLPGWLALREAPAQEAPRTVAALAQDGRPFEIEISLRALNVGTRDLHVATLREPGTPVHDPAAAQRYSTALARFGMEALAQTGFQQLLRAAPAVIAEAMQVEGVYIMRLSPARTQLFCIAAGGTGPGPVPGAAFENDARRACGQVVSARSAMVCRDLRSETRFTEDAQLEAAAYRGAAGVPLFDQDHVAGVLAVRSRAPREFGALDLGFLQSIANLLACAMQRSNIEEHLLHLQRLYSIGQLTGGIAHDFNNLLMVIGGNLQVLEHGLRPGSAERDRARTVSAAVTRGAALTRKLLAAARKQRLSPRAFDLEELLHDFRDLLERTLEENIKVELASDPQARILVADPAQLETALLNLALNARDAMPAGGTLTLSTSRLCADGIPDGPAGAIAPGTYACITVADSGTGMTPEVLAKAFDPFFTTKGEGKGSGLGLSMVDGFARQSGGLVRVETRPGRGTAVHLYLPLHGGARDTLSAPASLDTPRGSESVLVVEHDAEVRAIIALMLGRLGYRVREAPDAEAALELLRYSGDSPDLLFTDVELPRMDGIQLAHRARELRPGLRVLFSTGHATAAVLARLPESDAQQLIGIPFRHETLAHAVRAALDAPMPPGQTGS